MKFQIKGVPFSADRTPRMVTKAKELFDGFKDGDLYYSPDVAELLKISTGRFSSVISTHPLLSDYRICPEGRKLLWGNKKTIREYKKLG